MSTQTIIDFLLPAPACPVAEQFPHLVQRLLTAQSDWLIILDERQYPVGWIAAQDLLAVLWSHDRRSGTSGPGARAPQSLPMRHSDGGEWEVQEAREGASEPPIAIAEMMRSGRLRSLRCLAVTTPMSELLQSLPALEGGLIALIDDHQRYLGVLDWPKLWHWMALKAMGTPMAAPPVFSSLDSSAMESATSPSAGSFSRRVEEGQAIALAHHLLIQVMNHLPMPLMLQTGSGTMVAQNLSWQEQIGEVPDLRQQLTVVQARRDEISAPEGDRWVTTVAQPAYFSPSSSPTRVEDSSRSLPVSTPSFMEANQCHVDVLSNTCVCVCTDPDGYSMVWQFTTISLGDVHPLDGDATTYDELWLVLAQDNTEQQRVGRELAAKNADLIQLNRLKDEFLSCISHELKTPLTAILGLSSLLKDQALGQMSDRQVRYAQLIYQSSRHLMLIVNDILDLTRIETGQLELILEPVNLEVVCHRAYEQVMQGHPLFEMDALSSGTAPTHTAVKITFQTELQHIVADELRLRQMLSNLLSNAIKFTPAPGTVGLEVEDWGHWLAFTVWDTGIGIPADKQHLIFQKFQQLEHPLTRQFEGTGLGLVLTQRLARLHGGEVTFTSKEGQGSRFTILLPVVPPNAERMVDREDFDPKTLMRSPVNNRLMLVMESMPQLLDDVTYHLGKLGYKVAIARSGTEALEKTRQLQPAIVFLDPVLPQLSGWDVLTLLKSDTATSHIPIIAMTTRSESHRAEEAGVDGVLQLPIDGQRFERLVQDLLPTTHPAAEQYPRLTVLHLGLPHLHSDLEGDFYGELERRGEADDGFEDAWLEAASQEQPSTTSTLDGLSTAELNYVLHPYNCRVIEVDDVEQADVLSRVWNPDVVLLSDRVPDPVAYLKHISHSPYLNTLPIVTLTPEFTQAANQFPELTTYPCLDPTATVSASSDGASIPALLEVIRVATGFYWVPHVLLVDVVSTSSGQTLQPYLHYLERSGFLSQRVRSPADVAQVLQYQWVDLLLLCADTLTFNPTLVKVIQTLEQAPIRPPVLVWLPTLSQSSPTSTEQTLDTTSVLQRLKAIAAQVLPPAIAIDAVVAAIHMILGKPEAGKSDVSEP